MKYKAKSIRQDIRISKIVSQVIRKPYSSKTEKVKRGSALTQR